MKGAFIFGLCIAAFMALIFGTLHHFDSRWDADADRRCGQLGATATEIGNGDGHYLCIAPDGRVVDHW